MLKRLAAEAYPAQFELARAVEALRAEAEAGADANDALIQALAERRKTATGEVATAIETLEEKARELSGNARPGNRRGGWWRAPDETSWRHLAATLEALATAIDGAAPDPALARGLREAG